MTQTPDSSRPVRLRSQAAREMQADTSGRSWVSIQAAARLLQVSEKTIRRWIASEELPARRFGPKLIRVDLAALEAMGQPLTLAG